MNPSSTGIGFSAQRVPSLSKTAMRASGGTKSGEPSVVTRATKSSMALRDPPACHSVSSCAMRFTSPEHMEDPGVLAATDPGVLGLQPNTAKKYETTDSASVAIASGTG